MTIHTRLVKADDTTVIYCKLNGPIKLLSGSGQNHLRLLSCVDVNIVYIYIYTCTLIIIDHEFQKARASNKILVLLYLSI